MQIATGQPSRENQTGKSPANPGRFIHLCHPEAGYMEWEISIGLVTTRFSAVVIRIPGRPRPSQVLNSDLAPEQGFEP
jgi:hypothetical protein